MSETAESAALDTRKGQPRFIPIALASLRVDTVTDFDLYLGLEVGQPPVLYRDKRLPFTEDVLGRLKESRVKELYIEASQESQYQQYIERNLQALLTDDHIELHEKADILYTSARGLVKEMLEKPTLPGGVKRCQGLVENAIHFVFGSPGAFEYLLRVTSFDYYTYTHSVNVFIYSIVLAQRVGLLDYTGMSEFGLGTLLHDIGKSRIDPAILRSKGALTEEQWRIVKCHPADGEEILKERDGVGDTALDVVRHHHEKLDGSGYPDALANGGISGFARVVAIADIFDALTTRRTYRDALGSFPSLRTMREEMKGKIDDGYFRSFVGLMGKPSEALSGLGSRA